MTDELLPLETEMKTKVSHLFENFSSLYEKQKSSVLQSSVWSGYLWMINKAGVCSVPVHRGGKWCTKKIISNIRSDDSNWWNSMSGGGCVKRQVHMADSDTEMICNTKEQVECWTAPRDYHRGDREFPMLLIAWENQRINAAQGKSESD